MRKLLYVFPVALAVVTTLEVLSRFDPFLSAGRRSPGQAEVLAAFADAVLRDVQSRPPRAAKQVFFLGSSRSLPFGILSSAPDDPLLSAPEKETLAQFQFESRLALPRPDLTSQLLVLDRLAASDVRPDLIVFDLSPFVLYNSSLTHERLRDGIFPEEFLDRYANRLPIATRIEMFPRRHLTLVRYSFSWLRAIDRLYNGERYPAPASLATELLRHPIVMTPAVYDDRDSSALPPADSALAQPMIREIQETIFSNYDPELPYSGLLEQILDRLQENADRVVLWIAPVHPTYQAGVYAALDDPTALWSRYFRTLRALGASELPVYNGYENLNRCDYWRDISHYSERCYGTLTIALLGCANQPETCPFPAADHTPYAAGLLFEVCQILRLIKAGLGTEVVAGHFLVDPLTDCAFQRGPDRKFFVIGRTIRPRLDLITDRVIRKHSQRMPDAGFDINAHLRPLFPQHVAATNTTVIFECKKRNATAQNQKRFRLGRILVPMRSDVRIAQHDV